MDYRIKECVEVLKNDLDLLSITDAELIIKKFDEKIVFGYNSIDWSHYDSRISVKDITTLSAELKNNKCYIIWDEQSLPVIKTNIDLVIANFETITDIAFDTWIVDIDFIWIIENHHEDGINFIRI